MKNLLAISVVLLTTAIPVSAQRFWPDEGVRTWAPRATETGITANDLRTRLYQIADDSMMGREAGTKGSVMVTDYVAAEFKRLGLLPAGENGTYFQDIRYGQLRYDSTQVVLATTAGALKAGVDWSPMAPSAAQLSMAEVNLTNAPSVYAGAFGDSTAAARLGDVRGKVVIFDAPVTVAAEGNRPASRAPGDYLWAQRAGAAAVLVVQNPSALVFRTRTGVRPTATNGAPAALISSEAAARIMGRPLTELTVGAAGPAITARWSYQYTPLEYPTRNVLGILPGSDPRLKAQYVLIGAHNDHVGMVRGNPPEHDSLRAFNTVLRPQGANDRVALDAVTPAQWAQINSLIAAARKVRPARPDTVNNGADDDGSGTAVLLEIAESMSKGTRPARSIIFHSHAGEEKGLLGSAFWVDNPTIPIDSVVAAHNMDMLGKGRVTDVKFGGPASVQMLGSRRMSAEFGDVIDSLNAVRSEPMVIDYSWDRTNALNRFCRSDQVSYFRKGIPTTYFSLGYARDYHQPTDEPQYIDYDHSARLGRFVEEIARTVANRPDRLKVLPMAERDNSARC